MTRREFFLSGSAIAFAPSFARAAAKASAGRGEMWISPEEIRALPMEGGPWEQVNKAAHSDWGEPKLSELNYNHNTNVLAGALVAVRTDDGALADKVRKNLRDIPETENGGRTLPLGRNLGAYVVAAGLVEFEETDFVEWLGAVRHETLGGKTLISTHEKRGNNWGTHAGASRIAAAIYLDDREDLERAATVFAGFLGDREQYADFDWGKDMTWHPDPIRPVGVNPRGAVKEGRNVDGFIPDDMRRGGSFAWPPGETGYAWAALNGIVAQAELLHRQGHDAWSWSDRAILRAVEALTRIGWHVTGEDEEWIVHLVNSRYGTSFEVPETARYGKGFGWTDWTCGG